MAFGVCYEKMAIAERRNSMLVFSIDGSDKMYFSTPVSDVVFVFFHRSLSASLLLSMVSLITAYFKDSDWLTEEF